jgi:hypothetical protein
MTAEAEPTTERWVALGTRVSMNGVRASLWMDAAGGEILYADRASYGVGYEYEVWVKRTGNQTSRYGKPKFLGRKADLSPDQVMAWEAADKAAEIELAARSRERKARKQGELDKALAPLLVVAKTLHNEADRAAFAAYVLQKITVPWYSARRTPGQGSV